MRQSKLSVERREVGILIDGATSYGRQIMRGVMRYANAERRWLIREEMRQISSLPDGWPQCDGTIVGGANWGVYDRIRQSSRHVVQCTGSPRDEETLVVCLDDRAAGRMAAEHLLDCKLERFAFFGIDGFAMGENRAAGFEQALAERGFTCHRCPLAPSGLLRVTAVARLDLIAWLHGLPKPIGILAVDDSAAHELAAACLEASIAVPDRIAIIGVNNDDLLCESAWPPISSVEADFSRVGFLSAQLLDRLFAGEVIPPDQRITRLPPLGIVGRVSTDVLAVDDPQLAETIRYIRTHACDPCTVHDVLRHVPVGRRWLERQFTAKLGRSPHDEILRVRMDAARRLLTQSDFSLGDVALRCGFSAVASFVRAFTRTQGTPPGQFRRAAMRPS